MSGWETFIAAVQAFGAWLLPVRVVMEYERAIVFRLGRVHRELGPGIHPIWPLGIEHLTADNVVTTTTVLPPMSLTTADARNIVASPVLTWKIRDVRKLIVEVEGRDTVLVDSASGIIAAAVASTEWTRIASPDFADSLLREIRKRAFRYGIEVERVGFQSLAACESLRLWTDAAAPVEAE